MIIIIAFQPSFSRKYKNIRLLFSLACNTSVDKISHMQILICQNQAKIGGDCRPMDISAILTNLFVGPGPRGPRDIEQLKREHKISAVLNVQTDGDRACSGIDWPDLETHYRKLKIDLRRA
jgi:hypothetical protein